MTLSEFVADSTRETQKEAEKSHSLFRTSLHTRDRQTCEPSVRSFKLIAAISGGRTGRRLEHLSSRGEDDGKPAVDSNAGSLLIFAPASPALCVLSLEHLKKDTRRKWGLVRRDTHVFVITSMISCEKEAGDSLPDVCLCV